MGADPVSWALIASAIAATAGTANAIEQGAQSRRAANQAANGQRAMADQMMRDEQNQKGRDEATRMAIEQRRRQRMLASQFQGRQGTILTGQSLGASSPSTAGVGSAPTLMTPNKTLLGT